MSVKYSIKHLCKTCKHQNNWIGCFDCEGDWYTPIKIENENKKSK